MSVVFKGWKDIPFADKTTSSTLMFSDLNFLSKNTGLIITTHWIVRALCSFEQHCFETLVLAECWHYFRLLNGIWRCIAGVTWWPCISTFRIEIYITSTLFFKRIPCKCDYTSPNQKNYKVHSALIWVDWQQVSLLVTLTSRRRYKAAHVEYSINFCRISLSKIIQPKPNFMHHIVK